MYLRTTDAGVRVEYLPDELKQIDGVPDRAVLKAYNSEYDTLVYQDGNRLIWLVGGDTDSSTTLIYQLYTDEVEKLPDNRKQYGFDNRGFSMIANNEICHIGEYRVFEREIPADFHVIQVIVGFSKKEEAVWSQSFRINE